LRWALAIRRVTFANGDHDGVDFEATVEVVAERLVARMQQPGFDHRRGHVASQAATLVKSRNFPGPPEVHC